MASTVEEQIAQLKEELKQLKMNLNRVVEQQNRMQNDHIDMMKQMVINQQTTIVTTQILNNSVKATTEGIGEIKLLKSQIETIDQKLTELTYWNAPRDYDTAITDPRPDKQSAKVKLINMMAELFSEDDLTELLIDCNMPTDIKGNTTKIRAKNIVQHATRTHKFTTLIMQLAHKRPHVKWPFGTDWLEGK